MSDQQHIDQTLNHLFRQESGKMVAVLVKIFGTSNLELAEDVVQDALISALETWKFKGLPDNPRAWLYRTAKNKAIDIIRRERHNDTLDFTVSEYRLLTSEYTLVSTMDSLWEEQHIRDDFLGMMYACCHPEVSTENQITFILKSLCGFSTKEVAKAFLVGEDTISKRLYRTKNFFRKHQIRPQLPEEEEVVAKTGPVLKALYMMFNEGYNSTHSDELIRKDLMGQALLLCKELLQHPKTKLPDAYALMALMCYTSSRTEARLSDQGRIVKLEDQDRSLWDQEMIALGGQYMMKAAQGNHISTYHLEAAIAYEHCQAKAYKSTNWAGILSYYDAWLLLGYDPVVFLNRIMVVLELNGPNEALKELLTLEQNQQMQQYYLYHAISGAVYSRLNQNNKAKSAFEAALSLTHAEQEKQLLKEELNKLQNI